MNRLEERCQVRVSQAPQQVDDARVNDALKYARLALATAIQSDRIVQYVNIAGSQYAVKYEAQRGTDKGIKISIGRLGHLELVKGISQRIKDSLAGIDQGSVHVEED